VYEIMNLPFLVDVGEGKEEMVLVTHAMASDHNEWWIE